MKKLYHYCSIDTLESILKFKTLRFSSLSAVDDEEEAMTIDFDELGRICFVSCWTNKDEEDVTMWRTYTEDNLGNKSGVRISIPSNLFESISQNAIEKIESEFDIQISPSNTGETKREPDLFPVTYTDDENLINISVFKRNIQNCDNCTKKSIETTVNTSFLGKFKRSLWIGQSEWRYRISALPKEYIRNQFEGKYSDNKCTLDERIDLMNEDLKSIPFLKNYIDFPYNPEILKDIEVVSSPLNTSKDEEKINFILSKYTSGVNLQTSNLKIRKRNI